MNSEQESESEHRASDSLAGNPAPANPVAANRGYSSLVVSEITQVSLRQLQWWDEQKIVCPQHEGHRRLYLVADIIEVRLIAELRRKGLPLPEIKRVLRRLRREFQKRATVMMNPASNWHVVTDGASVYLDHRDQRIVEIVRKADLPMYLVSISDQVRKMVDAEGHLAGRKPVAKEMEAAPEKRRSRSRRSH